MKIKFISFLIVVFTLYGAAVSDVCKSQSRQKAANSVSETNPLNRSPANSIHPDSASYLIRIDGRSNTVMVNGQLMKTSPDSIDASYKNIIRVIGEGNTVLINHTDNQSEVKVLQRGENNRVTISQKEK